MFLENLLLFFYESWQWITAISTAVGLIAIIISFSNRIIIKTAQKTILKTLTTLCVVFIILSLIVGNSFSNIPDLTGKTIKEAEEILKDNNLSLMLSPNQEISNNDTIIIGQSDNGKKLILKDSTILVYTSEENDEESPFNSNENFVSVPNVVGMEQMKATELLTTRGLQFQVWWTEENNKSSEHYYVIDQSIPFSSEVPKNTIVKLELSPDKP